MKIFRMVLAIVLVVLGLASTVGSGGGNGTSTSIGPIPNISYSPFDPSRPPSPDYGNLDITVANAQDVAATAVRAHDHALRVATLIGGQVFPGLPSAPSLLSGNSKFELMDTALTTGETVTGACAISGMVTASPGGDTSVANLVFDTCDDGDGYSIDGRVSVSVREHDGDSRTDVFYLSYSLENMTLTIASDTESDSVLTGNRSLGLALDSRAFPEIVLTHSFSPLYLVTQNDTYSWVGGIDYLTLNTDLSPVRKLQQTLGSIMNSHFLDGYQFIYDTIVPLQTTEGQAPDSGEILINGGARNGTVHIVIESVTSVRLEIDADGDGTVDDYQYTTWAALRG